MKNGQPKTILLSGDDGIGKTYLLNEFVYLSKKANCQTIFLKNFRYNNIHEFYRALIFSFEKECNEIINNTLLKINSIYDEKLNWSETELKNALNIVKLQSSVNPNITSEQVSKSIKSSMKLFSRLKPDLDGSLDILSELLTDPWIIIASNFTNPADEIFNKIISLAKTKPENSSLISQDIYKENIINFLIHINNHIKSRDTALIIVIDHFEDIVKLEHKERESIKSLLSDIFERINKDFETHIMFLTGSSNNKQSITLGGELYTNFSNKFLVGPMEPQYALMLSHKELESRKVNYTELISKYISEYSRNNPFWITNAIRYADIAASIINLKQIDENFLRQFYPENPEELLNSLFSLLLSTFSSDPSLIDDIMKVVVNLPEPFSVFSVSKNSGVDEKTCQIIFDELSRSGFMTCSKGEGYYYYHSIVKDFFKKEYHNRDYFNSNLINLLKILNIIHQQINNAQDPSNSIRQLVDLCDITGHHKVKLKLLKLLEISIKCNNPDVRISALLGLKTLATPDALKILIKSASDTSPRVREAALNAVEHLIVSIEPKQQTLTTLFTALKTLMFDREHIIRLKAIEILGKLKMREADEALITLLTDKDDEIRATALKNTGKNSQEDYFYIYLEKMTDSSGKVRVIAAEQLAKYKTRQSLQILCAGLEDQDKLVRRACAKALGKLEYPEAAISLINALNDPDEDVKINIIKSLGKLKNKRAVPYLRDVLQSQRNDVILWATTRALADIPCRESYEILNNFTESNNPILQQTALYSIQKIAACLN